jgi:hypothetical protein
MMFNPSDDTHEKTRWHVVAQRFFAASAANVPCGVSAQKTACNGAGCEQPRIAAIRHKPEKK